MPARPAYNSFLSVKIAESLAFSLGPGGTLRIAVITRVLCILFLFHHASHCLLEFSTRACDTG